MRDAAAEGLTLLELRVSLLSTVDAIRTYNSNEAQAGVWDVARRTLEALLEVRRQESATSRMTVDFILSISCQNKYLSYIGAYVDLMKDYASEILAVDLTNEEENAPTTYQNHLERIRPHIKFLTIHCMETTKPERGWDALKLAPDRLGHGVKAIKDPKLVEELRVRRIPLEICPLGNLLTGVATSGDHPFRRFDEAGLILSINHDGLNDQTTLKDDYEFVQNTFAYSDDDMARFVRNGCKYAFRNMKQESGGGDLSQASRARPV